MNSAEIEAFYKQISSWPNQLGYILIEKSGISIRSSLNNAESQIYSAEIPVILDRVLKVVQGVLIKGKENFDDEIEFIRLKTLHHEILISPYSSYALVTLQHPTSGDIKSKVREPGDTGNDD